MAEMWIVAINQGYYPRVDIFATEEAAQLLYNEYVSDEYVGHAAVYIGRIEKATHTKQKDLGWQPIRPDDPEYDGYCDFCRDQQMPEGEWTGEP